MRDAAGALDRHDGSRTGAIAPSGPRPRFGTGYWQDDVLPRTTPPATTAPI
ncbi:hypothetical protein ACQPZG_18330 [Streptomyces sp. CA-294286]|uniref:hypothetical protein n=1 Tax=Streptomyces sp. CA-294286 TaxID=3240070 RepID=UPI003D8CC15E